MNFSFDVQTYGDLVPYKGRKSISAGRVRIFYKYENRNGTFISDEFANKLLESLPYTPIVGIYNQEEGDFEGHGIERNIAQVYGVVPENPDISWELHLDEDGVEREYACANVIIWTGRNEESKEILSKSQSMELLDSSIKGEIREIDGKKLFYFLEGEFIGLSALGDKIEPCFEGSAFYSNINFMLGEIENFLKEEKNKSGGNREMKYNFKFSDNAKAESLFDLLNPNCNEESDWELNYTLCEIYDNFTLVRNCEDGKFYSVEYSLNEDKIELGEISEVNLLCLSPEIFTSVTSLKSFNNDSFEKIDELFNANIEKINTLTNDYNILVEDKNNLVREKEELEAKVSELEAENVKLSEYKNNIELEEKQNVLDKYSALLDDDTLGKYKEAVSQYSTIDLEKELAYEVVKSKSELFSLETSTVIPTEETSKDSFDEIERTIAMHVGINDNGGKE